MAGNPVIFKVNKPGIQSVLGVLNRSLSIDFPHFLLALVSNNQFIIKLVKMWPAGTVHVVVGTLKISLDRLTTYTHTHKNDSSRVL